MPRILLIVTLFALLILTGPVAWGAPGYQLAYESEVEDQVNIYLTDLEGNFPQLLMENAAHPTMTSDGMVFFTRYEETVWGDFWKSYYITGVDHLGGVTVNTVFTELEPTVSRNGGDVVFQSNRAGTSEIIYVPLSPAKPTIRITHNNTDDVEPTIDGDGEHIYYVVLPKGNESYIYKANSDGSGQERLSKPSAKDRHPSVDAANQVLAFSSERDGNSEIYVMNLQTRTVSRLTDNEAWDGNPCISSDGKWIVFASDRDDNREIYVIGTDGKSLRRVTENEVDDDNPAIN